MYAFNENKRILKNTLFLYLRMFFSLSITLYTSRVVLKVLGVDDFGIYNVVGGVVTLFSFLNTSMSGATARFISFELGRKKYEKLSRTFSAAVLVHGVIALILILLGETIGLWFLNTQLVIPPERFIAANFVYQFSLLSAAVTVLKVPYNASIIAYEKMDVYAYIEITHIAMKLVIVLLLLVIPFDKLISYSFLFLNVNIIIYLVYFVYCRNKLTQSCRFSFVYDKTIFKPMLSFSGWDLYGNASTLARTQGVNMLLNIFFGTVLNAASGIATQVQGAVISFASNVVSAFRPQIVKSYAQQDYNRMVSLIYNASLYTSMLLLLFTIPLLVETEFILTLWLGEWPEYAAILCRYVLLFNLFSNLSFIVVTGLHATGKIKRPSLINGTFYLSVIPITYIGYRLGMPAEFAFIYNVIAVACGLLSNIYSLNLYVPHFSIRSYIAKVLLKCICFGLIVYGIVYSSTLFLAGGLFRLFIVAISTFVLLSIITYLFILSPNDRQLVKNKISNLL